MTQSTMEVPTQAAQVVDTAIPVVLKGTYAPEGVKYRGENGTVCFKVSSAMLTQVLALGSAAGRAQVASFDDARIERALAWVTERQAETKDVYVVMPVRAEYRGRSYGQYLRALGQFKSALQDERARRFAAGAFQGDEPAF